MKGYKFWYESYKICYTLLIGSMEKEGMVFIPHIVGFGALGVGRAQRYFYFSNRDFAMSSFILNNHLPLSAFIDGLVLGSLGLFRTTFLRINP